MFTIKTLNAISPVGLAKLPKNLFDVSVDADAPDGILVRSADLLNTTFKDNLLAIARAGAGVNNIPLDRCSEAGHRGVQHAGRQRQCRGGAGHRHADRWAAAMWLTHAQWTQRLAGGRRHRPRAWKRAKSSLSGNEIKGKTLGVVGLGAIGSRVANCAIALGMEVYGYDPYISIDAAWNLSSQVHHCVNLNDMLPLCDYITLHVPYLPTTKDTINTQTLALCKDGVKHPELRPRRAGEHPRPAGRHGDGQGFRLHDRFPHRGPAGQAGRRSAPRTWAPPPRKPRTTAPSWQRRRSAITSKTAILPTRSTCRKSTSPVPAASGSASFTKMSRA